MDLPTVDVVRERIEKCSEESIRLCLMSAYLFCGRVSEVIGKASLGDTTVARGPKGSDAREDKFSWGTTLIDATVFRVKTAKRGGLERLVAVPSEKKYDPWVLTVYDYFKKRGEQTVFPFTRQRVWQYSKEVFEGLQYPIERYRVVKGKIVKVVDRHFRDFRTHALRHMRATELIEYYGFDGIDLSIYGGWTLRSMIGVGSAMQRYAHLQWRKYFPKLLKPRD